jgi:hypothetical protein
MANFATGGKPLMPNLVFQVETEGPLFFVVHLGIGIQFQDAPGRVQLGSILRNSFGRIFSGQIFIPFLDTFPTKNI